MMMALRAIPIPIEESVRHLPSRALIDRSLPVFISMPDDVTKRVPMPHVADAPSPIVIAHLAFETRGILASTFPFGKLREEERKREREREKERKRERGRERESASERDAPLPACCDRDEG